MELYVFDLNLTRLGIIKTFNNVAIERNYHQRSVLELIVELTPKNAELLQFNRILTTKSNVGYGFLIQNALINETENTMTLYAYSLNALFGRRGIYKQSLYTGNVENVLKTIIKNRCISGFASASRVFPNFILAPNQGISKTVETTAVPGTNLEEFVWEYCQQHDISVDVFMNHTTKKFEVTTWQGNDYSQSNALTPVIFSAKLNNVSNIEFAHDELNYRTTAYVLGEQKEDVAQVIEVVNNSVVGFDRREVVIDASDLQSEYVDEDDNDVFLTAAQYKNVLKERGNEQLADMTVIETFEGEVIDTQFKYGIDYQIGDIVSFRSDKLNRILHTRVMSVTMSVDENGKQEIKVSFGQKIPTLLDKIKKAVKR